MIVSYDKDYETDSNIGSTVTVYSNFKIILVRMGEYIRKFQLINPNIMDNFFFKL